MDSGIKPDGRIIQYSLVWSLLPGKSDKFKKLIDEATEIVRSESRVLAYNWYFTDDESRCGLIEVYPESAAIEPHLKAVGEVLTRMLGISKISRFDVFGPLEGRTRENLEKMGARLYSHWKGFTR